MKRILIAVSGMTLLMNGFVYAQTETPVIDQRQMNQEQRVDQGISSGQVNRREAGRLDRQQDRIDHMEIGQKRTELSQEISGHGLAPHRIVRHDTLHGKNTIANVLGIDDC